MIIGTITLITMLFFAGGTFSPVLIEDAKKEIKTYVTDENTQKEVLLILDAQTKANKSYQKQIGKYKKNLKEVNADCNSKEEDLKKVIGQIIQAWSDFQAGALDRRMELQTKIKQEEWDQIIARSLEEPNEKQIKKSKKEYDKFVGNLAKTKEVISENIDDPDKTNKALAAFQDFEESFEALTMAVKDRNMSGQEEFQNINAAREDLQAAMDRFNKIRGDFYDDVLNLHFKLREYTTEDEFKKIIKAVNKLL